MPERESIAKTLGVAAGVAFVCALLVSSAVYWLRPIQLASSSIGYTRAVLEASGTLDPNGALSDREVVERFLDFEVLVVDLQTQAITRSVDAGSYDFRAEIESGEPGYMPIYLAFEDDALATVVLPFFGRGMWSTIYGMLALEDDYSTIRGIAIYEHGETPGIGDRIQNPDWLAKWRGKRLYDARGALRFRIPPGADPDSEFYGVDSITGATVTATSVGRAIARWFGGEAYGPALASLRETAP